jgi:RimJ/RimL family protein N-acetyltransferase
VASGNPDWQPVLHGTRVHLRPIRADDFDALHQAASDPLIWAQHSVPDRHERAVFRRFFDGALACGGGLVAQDPLTARVIGSSRFYDWNPADRSVVIGYSFLERAQWGTGANREMKSLMIAHAFHWADTVWFHVSPGNARSQRALEKIGAQLHETTEVSVGGVMSPRQIFAVRRPM